MHRLSELVRLHRIGRGAREVASLLEMSPNTEREYRSALEAAGLLYGTVDALPSLAELREAVMSTRPRAEVPKHERSGIEAWREKIAALMDDGLEARAIYDGLRTLEEDPYAGSYSQIKRMVRAIRRDRPVDPTQVAIPVVTDPGDVAQVDFGYVGWLLDPSVGRTRKAWCFVMVLAHSRRMVVRVVFDQRAETWSRLHVEAFEELGCVPRTIVPDNLKAAVVRAAFSAREEGATLHRGYISLARHYGFVVDPTPPRSPEKKGRVESGVKYVKNNFFAGRNGQNVDEVRRALARWVELVANDRIHGTTGQKPAVLFESDERSRMLPLSATRFDPSAWSKSPVRDDSHIYLGLHGYSVPFTRIGQSLWIEARTATITIHDETDALLTYPRDDRPGRTTIESHLPEGRRDLRHRSRAEWERRADALGSDVRTLVDEVFASDRALSKLPAVQAIVLMLERIPEERAASVARRASHYGATKPSAVATIIDRGLEREPLPTVATLHGRLDAPRFARPFDFFRSDVQVPDETH